MKRFTNMLALALICSAMACNDSAKTDSIESKGDTAASTASTDQTPTVQDSAAMMKAWMDYMTPGPMHARLAKDNGTWDADITMWMTPDAPPQKSTGTCEFKMIMGGRYQQGNFRSSFNGMPFEGVSTTGYDNAKKVMVVTWVDNMGTGIMTMEGTYDSVNNVANFSGKSIDPTTGKECTMRQVWRRVDENTMHEEMYATYQGGKEYKSMEMTYKRKR